MTLFAKSFQQLFVASFLMVTCTTNAMHDSQLQLQNPTQQNETMVFDCSLMISSIVKPPVTYAETQVHNNIRQQHNLSSTITDPVIWLIIINKPQGYPRPKGYPPFIRLPLKNCFNLKDGASLEIYDSGKSAIYEGKPLLINGICTKNSALPGDSFNEQINNAANKLYSNPRPRHMFEGNLQEFENAGIVTSTITSIERSILNYNTGQLSTEIVQQKKLSPGPNVMKNTKDLIQSIMNEKIKNKNVFLSLMDRQLTGK